LLLITVMMHRRLLHRWALVCTRCIWLGLGLGPGLDATTTALPPCCALAQAQALATRWTLGLMCRLNVRLPLFSLRDRLFPVHLFAPVLCGR
jgi:hypothetical protein